MPDREKVISKIEKEIHLGEQWGEDCLMIDSSLLRDALSLLKEQEDMGKELTDATELVHKKNARIIELIDLLKEQPEIVRCKDCVYHENEKARSNQTAWLPCMEIQTKNNWYCANGERNKKCVL